MLDFEACRALKSLGYPQGDAREPSTMWWGRSWDGSWQLTAAPWQYSEPFACPDSSAALDWLTTKGGYKGWHHGVSGYWFGVGNLCRSRPFAFGPYTTPSGLILAVAEREAK